MSPRHPLSADSRDRGLPFWGGLVVLAILVVTIRWTRGPAPADLTSGPTPLPPGPAAPAASAVLPTPRVPLVQAPVPAPAVPLPAMSAPAAQPLPAVAPALPTVGPAVGSTPTFIPQVGPGKQSVAMLGVPVVTPVPAPTGTPIPQVGAPAAPGLTILPTGKPPVVNPAQLAGPATVPRVIPAYWVLTVQMPPVNAILPAPDGRVWAATDRGLAELRTDQITFLSREAGTFPAANATALAHDGRALWVGTFEGLLRTEDGRTFQRFGRPDGLAHDMVWSLDWDGMVLWAGTQNGFSFLAPNGRFESVDKTVSNGGLADLWVGALRKMGRWVLCGNDDGLSIWDTSSFAANPAAWITLDQFETDLVHNWILALTVWQDRVYAGTPQGLCRLDTPLDRLFAGERSRWDVWNRSRGLPGERVNALAPLGDTLWVGTNEGLARVRGGGVRAIGPSEGLLASEVRALAGGGETVWVGTSAGLQALNPALLDR